MYTNWVFKLKGTSTSGDAVVPYVLLVAALGGGQAWGIEVLRGGRDSRSSLEEHVGGGSLDQVRFAVGPEDGTCQAVGDGLASQNIVDAFISLDHDLSCRARRAVHSQDQRLSVGADLPLDEGGLADLGEGIFLRAPQPARLIVLLGFFPNATDQLALLRHDICLFLPIGQGQQ